ncbi:MAG TPA: SGNH/GDSL hydrolase family protein, partial [Nocardioides sp.]|nr:SGNH/GDSL hydrolase family protein [Nocardioides sp.]
MSRVRTALVSAGVLSAGAALTAHGTRELLRRQASAARRVIGKPHGETAPSADRVYKKRYGDRIELLVLGDSIAAGLGAELPRHTLGARLARKTAK